MCLLMIIDNLDIRWTGSAFRPFEANPPLIVDADAVLASSVSFQRFKPVARQNGEIFQLDGRLETVQLQPRGTFDTGECFDTFAGGEIGRALVPIADDHRLE